MDLKMMKQLAEREIIRYRDNRAYVQGVVDGCGDHGKMRLNQRVMWMLAVDMAKDYWEKNEPQKALFFKAYYRTDRPRKRYELKPTIRTLAMELHVSEPTLYKWRNELITTVVLAAIQIGALHPYDVPETNGTAQNALLPSSKSSRTAAHGNE